MFRPASLMPILAALLLAQPMAGVSPQAPAGPLQTSFKVLAGFHLPDAIYKAKPGHVRAFIPASVRNLDGREVALTGFMLPIRIHNRLVTEFMLLRTQNTCCFGIPPELHEVVEVLKIDTPTKVLMDTPVTVVGHLHVRERWDGTFLCSIYQMDAERVTEN
ncbi:MAG: DUF3299 domain-containing protein [Holophaga sp.]|nr:DUF3299 domain-containing protein [Holophaga sp.]